MNGGSIMAGMIQMDASAPLGLPECYGSVCVVLGFLAVALVLWFCPSGCEVEVSDSSASLTDIA